MDCDITLKRPAGPNHQVVTVVSVNAKRLYRREPCTQCPWRKDAVGVFPAKAFKHSAQTAYDMSEHMFGCHESGVDKSCACAGFLLNGADHNLAVRLARMKGQIRNDVSNGGHALHASYREMAIANGVSPADRTIQKCR